MFATVPAHSHECKQYSAHEIRIDWKLCFELWRCSMSAACWHAYCHGVWWICVVSILQAGVWNSMAALQNRSIALWRNGHHYQHVLDPFMRKGGCSCGLQPSHNGI